MRYREQDTAGQFRLGLDAIPAIPTETAEFETYTYESSLWDGPKRAPVA